MRTVSVLRGWFGVRVVGVVALVGLVAAGCVAAPAPYTSVVPGGSVDSVTIDAAGNLRVTGWAGDVDSSAPLRVVLWVDGQWVRESFVADGSRPDVDARHGRGASVGFDVTRAGYGGTPVVCVVAVKVLVVGQAQVPVYSVLGCRTAERLDTSTTTTTTTTPPSPSLSVGAGRYHTCEVTAGGGVKCWGYNHDGELGDGTTTYRSTPVDVSGLTSGASKVAGGYFHTCAVTTGGGVKCWGSNSYGQLGDGTTTNRLTAVDVSGLASGVVKVVLGAVHTCALTAGGGVKCWGDNESGELGDGTTTNRSTAVDVSGLTSGVVDISAGLGDHTCALTTGGGVKCWGYNGYGGLGDGTTTNRLTPVDVSGLGSGVSQVSAANNHTCAVTTGGGVKCWGANGNGQLGDGTTTHRSVPVDVSGLTSGASKVAGAISNTCALTTGGGVKCWGYNGQGELGDGTTTDRSTPVDVSGSGSGVSQVIAGGLHTCAVTTADVLRCWGYNTYGQLGDGTTTNRSTPVDVLT